MRHNNQQGIAYSISPFGSARQLLLVGEPEERYTCQNDMQGQGKTVPDYPRQIRTLLRNVREVCEEQGFTENTAVMCHFFLANIGMKELVRQLADAVAPQFFRRGAITFVPQAPASGAAIALEILAWGGKKPEVACERSYIGQYAVAKFDDMRWLMSGECMPERGSIIGAYNRARSAFSNLDDLLGTRNFRLDQLLRVWIYQGHFLLPEGDVQRYQELNRARTDAFAKTRFLKNYLPQNHKGTVYPASTGIGADDFDVVLSGIALDTKRKDVMVMPLENPNQTSAFHYSPKYSPKSPKFSRAMAVSVGEECLIFVSGTASIIDSESQHVGDPMKQAEQTLDNIATLIDGENLARHGLSGMSCGLGNLEGVRVYVKRAAELDVIRQVCERRLPDVPILYTIADICRPELLVEMEGIALARK